MAKPLTLKQVVDALKESRGCSGPPLVGLGGLGEEELQQVCATVEGLEEAKRLLSVGFPKLQILNNDDAKHAAAVHAFVWGKP